MRIRPRAMAANFFAPVRRQLGSWPIKLSGAQSRPTMKEREKFKVARADKKRPRRRSENDLMRRYCWGVGAGTGPRFRRAARANGRRALMTAKMWMAEVKYCRRCQLSDNVQR